MGWGSWDSQSPNLDPNSPLLPLALWSWPPAIGGGVGVPPILSIPPAPWSHLPGDTSPQQTEPEG